MKKSDKDKERKARRAFEHVSSGSTADLAVEGRPDLAGRSADQPYARRAEPLAPDEKPDQLAAKVERAESREEARIDEGSEESFPASDPPSFQPSRA